VKYDIGPEANSILGALIQQAWDVSWHTFFKSKNHTNKLARPLGVKGLGPIWAFWPITSEDFKPLTQRIGPASKCKAVLRATSQARLRACDAMPG
jgi:hypothetical protein